MARATLDVFRHPSFRRYQTAGALLNLAIQTQGVAVAWQVYDITRSPLDLGLVGLYQFIPICALALVAGPVADRFNRRAIVMLCTGLLVVCAALLALLSWTGSRDVRLIYAVLALLGCARAFYGPAASTVTPLVVPSAELPHAVGWGTTIWQITTICGPPLGGFLYAVFGNATLVYATSAVMFVLAVFFQSRVELPPTPPPKKDFLASMHTGIVYVWKTPALLGAVSLDLFAVLLGGAVALLPVFARDILHVDSDGLGYLRAAPAVGASAIAIVLAVRPLERRVGVATLLGVAVFGAATIVFGLSRSFPLSMFALFVTGAADMVSVFVRQNLRQLLTPNEMRGRVSAVTGLFVSVSNELGEFESGLMAHWFGTVESVVIGGLGTIVVVVIWVFLFPALRKMDRIVPLAEPTN